MVQAGGRGQVGTKGKAIATLFPYAVWRERGGDNKMVDALSAIIRAPWGRKDMAQPIFTLLGKEDFDFPSWVVTLMSPHVYWRWSNADMITRWAVAALAVPYTEDIGQSVVDTLLQIACYDHLQPHIPVDIWTWLKKQPSLPPICEGRYWGTEGRVVRRVRELGDVEILESYFLLVWSEWDYVQESGLGEMCTSIREEFGGIGMRHHREVLIKRLNHVLGELDKGLECLRQQRPYLDEDHIQTARGQYEELKKLLLRVDREALEILTRTPLIYSSNILTPADVHRISLDVRLCTPFPVSLDARPQYLLLVLPTSYFIHEPAPLCHSFSSIDGCPTLSTVFVSQYLQIMM